MTVDGVRGDAGDALDNFFGLLPLGVARGDGAAARFRVRDAAALALIAVTSSSESSAAKSPRDESESLSPALKSSSATQSTVRCYRAGIDANQPESTSSSDSESDAISCFLAIGCRAAFATDFFALSATAGVAVDGLDSGSSLLHCRLSEVTALDKSRHEPWLMPCPPHALHRFQRLRLLVVRLFSLLLRKTGHQTT